MISNDHSGNEVYNGGTQEPIAIIGMSCRFPGEASSVASFWDMMSNARTGHSNIPIDRFNADAWYHPDHGRKGAIHTKSGFFLDEDVAVMDAPFFSITAKEASGMDPMQRKLLEVAYESFENAGIPMETLAKSNTSVYTGVMTNDYEMLASRDIYDLPHNAASGTSKAMLANRISWFFDLRGPSLALDTACSSSLYAFHLACQSLRTGESEQALVGGVNMVLYPNLVVQLSAMHMLSPDGISHSFDARANGYARGEAIGAVVLKPLKSALANGDNIRAIVRGSGVNQDGKTPGITVPSGEAQAALIRATYAAAGLSYEKTGYFEAHGTGTPLGDPIELSAVGSVFGPHRDASINPLYIGSVKTNVGHTEGTAGLAGVIKSVLCLEKGFIPPNAGFETLNPKLQLKEWGLALPLQLMPWPTEGLRRISINSFGFGGSNAHVILDDAYHYLKSNHLHGNHQTSIEDGDSSDSGVSLDDVGISDKSRIQTFEESFKLIVFSAHDQAGVQRIAAKYSSYLQDRLDKSQFGHNFMGDLAHTLASRRTSFGFRSFAVAHTVEGLLTQMSKIQAPKRISRNDNVALVFTGQGAQWPSMGRGLLHIPVYKESLSRSQEYLQALGCKWNIFELLSDPKDHRVDIPEYCQPICTALQVALVDMITYWGVRPKGTVGHSSGEIAAAYAAGGISHGSAIKVAFFRGLFVDEIQKRLKDRQGTMMAVGMTHEDADELVKTIPATDGIATVACINSPSSVTLSGDEHIITRLETSLKEQGKFARKLRVDVAYHSAHMEVIAQDFLQSMGEIETLPKFKIPMFSSVTEQVLDSTSNLDAAYWVKNMVSPVRFSGAVKTLLTHTTAVGNNSKRKVSTNWSALVEVGPHEALKGPLTQIMNAVDSKLGASILYGSLLRRGEHEMLTAKQAAGLLWSSGHSINILRVNKDEDTDIPDGTVLGDLPSYSWQHSKRFWHEPLSATSVRSQKRARTDLLGVAIDNQNKFEPQWHTALRLPENPWMEDHIITGTILYPAAGMLIMVLEAAMQISESDTHDNRKLRGVEFHEVNFERGLVIPTADKATETSLSIKPHESMEDAFYWTVYSIPPGATWIKNSHGIFSIVYNNDFDEESSEDWRVYSDEFEDIRKRSSSHIDTTSFYTQLKSIGMEYGPLFTNLVEAAAIPGEHAGCGTIMIPDTKSTMPEQEELPHIIHPATLDAIFHLLFVAIFGGRDMDEAAIPVSLEHMFIAFDQPRGIGAKYAGFSKARDVNAREYSGDLYISNETFSKALVTIRNMTVRKVSSSGDRSAKGETHLSSGEEPSKRVGSLEWRENVDTLRGERAQQVLQNSLTSCKPIFKTSSKNHLYSWLKLLCHKEAGLKVLILNGEQDTDALPIVASFAPFSNHSLKFLSCKFLASSKAIATQLEATLRGLTESGVVDFDSSDLGSILVEDSPDIGAFDLVLRFSSHGVPEKTDLAQVRQLLRSGGRAALCIPRSDVTPTWDLVAQEAGFNDPDVHLKDDTTELIIASTSTELGIENLLPEVFLILGSSPSTAVHTMKENLTNRLTSLSISVKTCQLSNAPTLGSPAFISLLEVENPFVISWNNEELDQFRKVVFNASYMLWITHGGILEAGSASLDFAPTTGLLRTLRVEIPQISLPHVDLSHQAEIIAPSISDMVISVLEVTARKSTRSRNLDMEFVEVEGGLHIPRVFADTASDYEIALHSGLLKSVQGKLFTPGETSKHLKLEFGQTGSVNDSIWTEDDSVAVNSLGPEEVVIEISHVSLEGSDLGNAYYDANSLSHEAVGKIIKCGSEVHDFRSGDRVIVLKPGTFKTHIRQHYSLIQKVPENISSELAVSLPISFMNAYYALIEIARLERGEAVLIDVHSTSIRHAAVLIAQRANSGPIFIVIPDANERRESLSRALNIPEGNVLDSGEMKLICKVISRKTNNTGPNVILTTNSGSALRYTTSTIAAFGRLVTMSQMAKPSDLSPALFQRNATISSVNISNLSDKKRSYLLKVYLDQLCHGTLRQIFPKYLHSVSNLHQLLSRGNIEGRVVFTLDKDAVVPLRPFVSSNIYLDSTATYVLSGGLGALGLTIANNMISHGARHIVLLSRSGITKNRQREALERFHELGCRVDTYKCDVTDCQEVQKFVDSCEKNRWRIKGLVQCAMVLRDAIFENMTFDQWNEATKPKIMGTWNLHAQLPKDLDFFVLLSSMSGIIGNSAQSNYCAGNTYEDAMARYRHSIGLVATTLNVGLVTDASHFNESSTIEDYLKKYGHWMPARVTDLEMQIILSAVMNRDGFDKASPPTQLLVGIRDDIHRDGLNLWTNDRKFDHRTVRSALEGTEGANSVVKVEDLVRGAGTLQEAVQAVESALQHNVAVAMTASPNDIDVDKPLYSFGVDSLKAVEVRNWIFREIQCDISIFDILSPISLAKLAVKIVGRSTLTPPEVAKQALIEGS